MQIVPVYVGLDYHSDTTQVCVMTEHGEELMNRNVVSEPGCVVDAIQSCGQARSLKRASEAYSVSVLGVALEACTGSAEFAQRLEDATEWMVKLAHAGAVHRSGLSGIKTRVA